MLLQDVRKQACADLRQWRDFLVAAEQLAVGSTYVKDSVDSMVWPSWTWPRELLVGLAGCGSEKLPADLETAVHARWRGISSTVPCENVFKHLRKLEAASENSSLSRRSRYKGGLTSQVLEEHDLPPPPPITT